MYKLVIIFSLVFASLSSHGQGFVNDERYRGWLWFEEKEPIADNMIAKEAASQLEITPLEAREEIEQFAKELEELKYIMLARPTPQNVKEYREKEREMWIHAGKLHDAWDMANLLYPQQRDLIKNPVNVHAVKAKREMVKAENELKIKELAKQFELVLFFSTACGYCKLLSPVLKAFGERYGFNIEAINDDGTKHEYFKTANAKQLIEQLGITAFPTVIAISNDGQIAFELIRGYVSQSELEEHSLLAVKYLQAEGKWLNQ